MKDFSHILAIRFMQQEFEGFADYFLASYSLDYSNILKTQSYYPPFYGPRDLANCARLYITWK